MMNIFRRKKRVEEPKKCQCGLPKAKVTRNYNGLPESRKLIYRAIVNEYSTKKTGPENLPFNIYLITEEKLMEFKNDFGCQKNKSLRHDRYVEWLESLGLDYDNDRKIVQRIIRGIYNYTDGELDYRNARMMKEVKFEHMATRLKKEVLEKHKLF